MNVWKGSSNLAEELFRELPGQGSISLEQMNSPRSSQTEVDRFGRELSRNNECSMIVLAELAEVISASRVVPRRITFVSVETKVFYFSQT